MQRSKSSRLIKPIILCLWIVIFSNCTFPPPASCEADYLIYMIDAANSTPATTDTVGLPPNCTYTLTEVNNLTSGSNGLPAITSPIIINGNGSTIQRDPQALEKFRLFYVSPQGGDLTLNELNLTGGHSYDPAAPNNVPTNSGGAILNGGHLKVTKTVIKGNSGREGGGIYNANDMTLKEVTIDSNQDYFGLPGGAGIYNIGTGVIFYSTISHNGFNPYQPADGIFNAPNSTLKMTNSTVSRNGACGIDNEGDLILNHVTIAFNVSGGVGSAGHLYTSNSIFTSSCSNFVHPTFPNLDIDGSCGGMIVSLGALRLDPLANNGGLTETNALRPGSAAIDRVVRLCEPTDQRGVIRPQGPKCDVGAFEYDGSAAPAMAITETPTLITTPTLQACTFTAALNLFCRSGPGASLYPDVDSFTAGQSAPVVGQSADGGFAYVTGPNTGEVCAVPLSAKFGSLNGDCLALAVFTPPAPSEPDTESSPQTGCTVRRLTGPVMCVVPCPLDAKPGEPCTP